MRMETGQSMCSKRFFESEHDLRMQVDQKTNSIYVRANEVVLEKIKQVIQSIDVPPMPRVDKNVGANCRIRGYVVNRSGVDEEKPT